MSREKLLLKYNNCCGYCGESITLKTMQADHIHPKRKGGADNFANLMPACRTCNFFKSSLSLEQFRSELESKIEKLNKYYPVYRLSKKYKLITENPKPIKFYFEESKL